MVELGETVAVSRNLRIDHADKMREDAGMTDEPVLAWFQRAIAAMAAAADVHPDPALRSRSSVAAEAATLAASRPHRASTIRAQSALDDFVDSSDPLLRDVARLAPSLPWAPTTRLDDGGETIGLVDLSACIDLSIVGAGLMLVGAGVGYPEHQHGPAEVYLILQGNRKWRFGGADEYVHVDVGSVLSNNPNDLHGVEPGDDVLLAMWVLLAES